MLRKPLAIDASTALSFLCAASFGTHALRILARSGAKDHRYSQPGGAAGLHLAVCPSAARSPQCGAKVPHAVAAWLPVLRQSANHSDLRLPFMRISRPAMIQTEVSVPWFPALATSGTIPSSHTKGVLACNGQMLISKAKSVLAHPLVLLAPA